MGATTYIGIDPGVSGAIAVLVGGTASAYDMPVATVGKTRKRSEVLEGQIVERVQWALDFSARFAGPPQIVCWIEQVSAMPGQGVSSMFGFGVSYGIVRGVVAGLGIRCELVTPQAWKKHFGLIGADKDAARAVASRLFPSTSLARKKDVGRADALLIAEYGRARETVALEPQREVA